MTTLNYKHLRYFWMVAKAGSIARASEQLHLTPQSISGQISAFEERLGVGLFQRTGRRLVLTEAGQRILRYAEEIFALGDELLDVLHDAHAAQAPPFRVGIADSVPKQMAYRLVAPTLTLDAPVRLVCREGRLAPLLAELSVHHLDMVIADRPMPARYNVRAYSHLLGESRLTVMAMPALLARFSGDFPRCLDEAPFLLPGEDVAVRVPLMQWFEAERLRPQIVGEFDDSALLKAFGGAGAGFFCAPSAVAPDVQAQYGVAVVGEIPGLIEQTYGITTERKLTHPAIVAISAAAQPAGVVAAPPRKKPRRG
ncbi:MAG: transcriptional activator NhaR [Rhodocyclaceae bacterium]|nr:transcriptional activator NhaR [Rhodocyclaceae bacterium]